MNKKNLVFVCLSLCLINQASASDHTKQKLVTLSGHVTANKTYLQALMATNPTRAAIIPDAVSPLVAILQALIEYETQLALKQQQEEALEALNAPQAENN